jgi:hypothetical protein
MDTQSAQAEQLPKAVRSFIRVGNYIEKVLDTTEANAKARAAAGQQPNLLDDVMKDGQVHIANLEEVLADFTGRTKAKSVVELMTHAHGLMGLYHSVSDIFSGAKNDDPSEGPVRGPATASSQAPSFRADLTSAAKRAGQGAASAAPASHAAPAPKPHSAPPPASTAQTTTAPRMSLDDRLNALTMEVARHLQTFEQAVAVEHTELRGRMMQQSLELAGLRARIQVLESKLLITEEHAAVPTDTPVAAVPTDTPVAAVPAAPVEPAANCPVGPTMHTDDDVAGTKITACTVQISGMIQDSHAQVQTSLTEQRALSRAYEEKLLELGKTVKRLEGIVDDNRQRAEGEQGPPLAPPPDSNLETHDVDV